MIGFFLWDCASPLKNTVMSMNKSRPEGQLFSRTYLERGKPTPSTPRFRMRLASYLKSYLSLDTLEAIGFDLAVELGCLSTSNLVDFKYSPHAFLEQWETRDVLDFITIVYEHLESDPESADHWVNFVQRVLTEENIAYEVDKKGGVHYVIDEEFERNTTSTVAGLADKRFDGVRAAVELAVAKMSKTEPDLKGAIRDVFEATETLTKLMSGTGKNLTDGFAKSEFGPILQKLYASDPVAQQSQAKLLESFCDWVGAAHPYRHGQKIQSPLAVPIESAILLISLGLSYIRWLVVIDELQKKAGI